ncbi:hypothetical protein FKM82_003315 [Ascaphus truei]
MEVQNLKPRLDADGNSPYVLSLLIEAFPVGRGGILTALPHTLHHLSTLLSVQLSDYKYWSQGLGEMCPRDISIISPVVTC